MISPTCSNKGVRAHAIRSTLRQFWLLLPLGLGYFLYTIPGSLRSFMKPSPDSQEHAYFLLYDGGKPLFLLFGTAVFALLTAFCLFRFLFSEPATGAYFSLGVRRGTLFRIRYGIGAGILTAGILPPMLISLLLNLIKNISHAALLLERWGYVALLLWLTAMVIYTLTVLVCTLCGSFAEAAIYTLLLIAAPNLLGWAAGSLIYGLMPGAPFDAGSGRFLDSSMFTVALPARYVSSLLERSVPFGPFTFASGDLYQFDYISLEKDSPYGTASPTWGLPIAWLLVTIAAALLSAFLFQRRRAESAGFACRSRVLGLSASILLGLCVCAAFQNDAFSLSLRIVLGLAGSAAALLLAGLTAFRGPRRLFHGKQWIALPAAFGGIAALVLILYTGCFGRSYYIPAAEDIQSVQISYNGDPNFADIYSSMSGDSSFYKAMTEECTSQHDLALITELHRELSRLHPEKGARKNAESYEDTILYGPVSLQYTLKNGQKIVRNYRTLPVRMKEMLLRLDELDSQRAFVADRIRRILLEGQAEVLLSDTYMQNQLSLPLSLEEESELAECLIADLAGQTTEEHFFPSSDAEAILHISMGEETWWLYSDASMAFSLNDAYPQTLAFLRQRDVLPSAEPPAFLRAELFLITPIPTFEYFQGEDLFLQIRLDYGFFHDVLINNGAQISADQLADILPRLRSCWYASREVYLVRLAVPNDTDVTGDMDAESMMGGDSHSMQEKEKYIYKFLPADEAPDSLLGYLS